MDEATIPTQQLERMRGMTRYYHQRFFSDTRWVATTIIVLLLIGWWGLPEAFLLVPVVALFGANQTAFDASYLMFARHYARALEDQLNRSLDHDWLIGSRIEDRYLFPLDRRKVVVIGFGADFSWFAWMTCLYTVLGIVAFVAGVALGWESLSGHGAIWAIAYVGLLGALTIASLLIGWWWFVRGVGEERLREVIDSVFG
jgi:hypothetical protein